MGGALPARPDCPDLSQRLLPIYPAEPSHDELGEVIE